jgi:hypothetical protein
MLADMVISDFPDNSPAILPAILPLKRYGRLAQIATAFAKQRPISGVSSPAGLIKPSGYAAAIQMQRAIDRRRVDRAHTSGKRSGKTGRIPTNY